MVPRNPQVSNRNRRYHKHARNNRTSRKSRKAGKNRNKRNKQANRPDSARICLLKGSDFSSDTAAPTKGAAASEEHGVWSAQPSRPPWGCLLRPSSAKAVVGSAFAANFPEESSRDKRSTPMSRAPEAAKVRTFPYSLQELFPRRRGRQAILVLSMSPNPFPAIPENFASFS